MKNELSEALGAAEIRKIVVHFVPLKWAHSGAKSGLNHVSAGCFMRMTGYAGRSWPTSLVNAS